MKHTIEHNLNKQDLPKLIKKALSGKMAIISDNPDKIVVGTPPFMLVDIIIEDNVITIDGGKAGGNMLATTAKSEIEMAISDLEEKSTPVAASTPIAEPVVETQSTTSAAPLNIEEIKTLGELFKNFHVLCNEGVITEEEFSLIKKGLIEKITK